MWSWLEQHYNALSALFSFLTLVVWAVYLQIFLTSYHRTTRPKILINRGAGHWIDAKCAITNMSAEAIYIEAVVVILRLVEQDKPRVDITCSLSDLDIEGGYSTDPRPLWFQGPLGSAEMIDIGTYRSLLEKAVGSQMHRPLDPACVKQMTIRILATYIADDHTIGAERSFNLKTDGDHLTLDPIRLSTRQMGRTRA